MAPRRRGKLASTPLAEARRARDTAAAAMKAHDQACFRCHASRTAAVDRCDKGFQLAVEHSRQRYRWYKLDEAAQIARGQPPLW